MRAYGEPEPVPHPAPLEPYVLVATDSDNSTVSVLCMGTEEDCTECKEICASRVTPNETLDIIPAVPSDGLDAMLEDSTFQSINRYRKECFRQYSVNKGEDYDRSAYAERANYVHEKENSYINHTQKWKTCLFRGGYYDFLNGKARRQRRYEGFAVDQQYVICFPMVVCDPEVAAEIAKFPMESFSQHVDDFRPLWNRYLETARVMVVYHSVWATEEIAIRNAHPILLSGGYGSIPPRVIPTRTPIDWRRVNWEIGNQAPTTDPYFLSIMERSLSPAQMREHYEKMVAKGSGEGGESAGPSSAALPRIADAQPE